MFNGHHLPSWSLWFRGQQGLFQRTITFTSKPTQSKEEESWLLEMRSTSTRGSRLPVVPGLVWSPRCRLRSAAATPKHHVMLLHFRPQTIRLCCWTKVDFLGNPSPVVLKCCHNRPTKELVQNICILQGLVWSLRSASNTNPMLLMMAIMESKDAQSPSFTLLLLFLLL